MSDTVSPSVVVATHGHCFDGMCSAAIFTRLARHVLGDKTRFTYRASGYGPQERKIDGTLLVGRENAILDFRYTAIPEVTWYFDHHETAFSSPDDRRHFEADGGKHKFYDPRYGSCTKLIHDIARERFGLVTGADIAELVRWADIIDSARFPSAEMAVARSEPALWLMTVVEHHGDDSFLSEMVPLLLTKPLDEVARSPEVQQKWAPLEASHRAFVEKVRKKSEPRGRVIYVDLTDEIIDVVGKFVTYALYPESTYSVMVSRGKSRCKISVGYNPWSGKPRQHDISSICVRYGGGGHAVVGAVAVAASEVERAKEIAREIAHELDN
jgi:hypothetical protein